MSNQEDQTTLHQKTTSLPIIPIQYMLKYCMFYEFLEISRDLEINRLKVRGYL
jgi:hypothetical protein